MDWKRIIKEETENSGIVMFPSWKNPKKKYPYVILPFESRLSVNFQKAYVIAMKLLLKKELKECNCLLLPEAKAFLLAPLALATNKEIVLIRKRDYLIHGQIVIKQEKAYRDKKHRNMLYCVGLDRDDRPLLIDDMISSGNTSIGIIKAIESKGLKLTGIAAFYERGEGMINITKETGYRPKAVARLEVVNDSPKCFLHDF